MFTGLVEEIGVIHNIRDLGRAARLSIAGNIVLDDLKVDDSISVNGVCLTVVGRKGQHFEVDAVDETLRKSTLGLLKKGSDVNLERCLRPLDRMGGHIVQGHVDGIARVTGIQPQESGKLMHFEVAASHAKYIISEGSIAIDGVSLTIAQKNGRQISVALIPHTLSKTNLGKLSIGDRVNIEVDLIGKYVESLLKSKDPGAITQAFVRQAGFQD